MTETTCRQGVRLLTDYLEGVIPRKTRLSLERHVGGCRRCRGFVASYAATPGILRRATASPLPSELRRNLRERLGKERRS